MVDLISDLGTSGCRAMLVHIISLERHCLKMVVGLIVYTSVPLMIAYIIVQIIIIIIKSCLVCRHIILQLSVNREIK